MTNAKQPPPFLAKPCTTLPGVGPSIYSKLNKCGINTIEDLLFHLPYRYQDRTRITPIHCLRHNEFAVIEGLITQSTVINRKRKQLVIQVADSFAEINIRFFHFNTALKESFATGARLRCFGQAKLFGTNLEMVHPEFQILNNNQPTKVDETLTPIYATTQGLSQKKLKELCLLAFEVIQNEEIELLPSAILEAYQLPSIKEALIYIHTPPPDAPIERLVEGEHPFQKRIALEELLTHHLSMRRLKESSQKHCAPKLLSKKSTIEHSFIKNLAFSLTKAQQKAFKEIKSDLIKNIPMQRLVQGDVGSGKTVVAALSALQAIEANYQVALMAPTELLAEQHAHNFEQWFKPLGISITLLVGKQSVKKRNEAYAAIKEAKVKMIIGTHALFQEGIDFKQLGLVIIDEQHRFGVKQRLSLQEKGHIKQLWPHLLIMSATPIPRTLAMTQYANLDISIIDELPPGRTPVQTAVIDNQKRALLIERLKNILKEKKQAYWVCTLIEESEVLQCQAAEETANLLAVELPSFRIGLVHGRMKSKEKLDVMEAFKTHKIDLLVATTVIEVGVDVPNASLMVIENAERLGLFQLHQLRGRVGRGANKSHCLLMYQSPLSEVSRKRLEIIRKSNDGFLIAKEDLKLRGYGKILGTQQTGLQAFKIACLNRDKALFNKIVPIANELIKNYPSIIAKLIQRWLGESERYSRS